MIPLVALLFLQNPVYELPVCKTRAEIRESKADLMNSRKKAADAPSDTALAKKVKAAEAEVGRENEECVGKAIKRLDRFVQRRSRHRLHSLTSKIREARCQTALCWWPDNFWGLEVLAEAPLGATFAVGQGNFSNFLDNGGFSAQLTAGLRLWTAWDWVSVSVYFSKLVFQSSDANIRIKGFEFEHPVSSVRRPYPGVALGLVSDILWLGLDYNALYNGSGVAADPHFPEHSRITGAFTLTISIAPITLARSIGAAVKRDKSAVPPEAVPTVKTGTGAPEGTPDVGTLGDVAAGAELPAKPPAEGAADPTSESIETTAVESPPG